MTLSIWQSNLHHCKAASDNIVSEVAKMKTKPVILVQEPYLFRDKPSLRINNYVLHYGGKNSRSCIVLPRHLNSFFVQEISDRDTSAVLIEEDITDANSLGTKAKKYLFVSSYLDILDKNVKTNSSEATLRNFESNSALQHTGSSLEWVQQVQF